MSAGISRKNAFEFLAVIISIPKPTHTPSIVAPKGTGNINQHFGLKSLKRSCTTVVFQQKEFANTVPDLLLDPVIRHGPTTDWWTNVKIFVEAVKLVHFYFLSGGEGHRGAGSCRHGNPCCCSYKSRCISTTHELSLDIINRNGEYMQNWGKFCYQQGEKTCENLSFLVTFVQK